MIRSWLLLTCAALLTGCATFSDREMALVRSRGVYGGVAMKLDLGKPLTPADVVELTRAQVPEEMILRQIDDHGVDSIIGRDDVKLLRQGGVSAIVIDALLRASDDFAREYGRGRPDIDRTYGPIYGDVGGGPGEIHGSVGIGFSTGGYVYPHRRRY